MAAPVPSPVCFVVSACGAPTAPDGQPVLVSVVPLCFVRRGPYQYYTQPMLFRYVALRRPKGTCLLPMFAFVLYSFFVRESVRLHVNYCSGRQTTP